MVVEDTPSFFLMIAEVYIYIYITHTCVGGGVHMPREVLCILQV